MTFFKLEEQLFPDDVSLIPEPGSPEQQAMIKLMEHVCDDDYEENLDFLEIPFAEVLDNHLASTIELLKIRKGEELGKLRILDLGTGMGLTTINFLQRFSAVETIYLVDLSSVLLGRAKKKIQDHFPEIQVEILQCDLLINDLDQNVSLDSFDLVLASNFFEHIPRLRQAQLFAQVNRVLHEGGVFSMVAHLKLLLPHWKEKLLASFLNGWCRGLDRDPKDFESSLQHFRNEHIHVTLPQVFSWLNQSGFQYYDCPYRRFIFGVVLALK